MADNKIKKINDLLQKVYCFDQAEIGKFMFRVPHMKKEGQNKLIKTLEDGLKEQDEMLKKWIARDPEYAVKLADFVVKTSNKMTREYEEKEKGSADEILTELE